MDGRSEKNLSEVHPDLVRVIRDSFDRSPKRFVVIEGRRSIQRQADLIASGASAIKDPAQGRHVQGMAVDVMLLDQDGRAVWETAAYRDLASVVLGVSRELGIPVTWGGSWRSFPDGPHFELPRDSYPGSYIVPDENRTVQT